MKFVSWNVNGLRACVGKGFMESFRSLNADFFCLQETKLQEGQIDLELPGYHQYWCYAEKKGYSGTAIFAKYPAQAVTYGLGIPELDNEGRVTCLEYPEFFLITCYTPNAQRGLARIEHRLRWEEAFRAYLQELDRKKPVILCGDLNVAHKEIDLKNPSSNRGNAGFSDQERDAFSKLLELGFTDTFRHLYPDKTGAYSWWSYMFNARANNAGWRIDYFVVSNRLTAQIYDATIHPDILGSDHCPVGLDLDTTCNDAIPIPELTHINPIQEADGASSAGSFRHWAPILTVLLVMALLTVPLFFLRKKESPAPSPTTPQPTQAADNPLIYRVINQSGRLNLILESTPYPHNSVLPNLSLTDGTEHWRLYGWEFNITALQNMTYCLQIVFDPSQNFTQENCPEITPFDSRKLMSSSLYETEVPYCYYQEEGRILGCFVFDTVVLRTQVYVRAFDGVRTEQTDSIPINPVVDFPLITQVVNHHADIQIEVPPMTSSHYGATFSNGAEVWNMFSEPSVDLSRWKPNFFLEIQFPAVDFAFGASMPNIELDKTPNYLLPDNEDYILDLLFYTVDGRVAGAFIFGYTSAEIRLPIMVSYTDYTGKLRQEVRSVDISPSFSEISTYNLAYSLRYSKELSFYLDLGSEQYLEAMIQSSPALQTLLSREDAMDTMLQLAKESSCPSFIQLLQTDYFLRLMTPAQRREAMKLIPAPA